MAKKQADASTKAKGDDVDDITSALIRDINAEFGLRVAYNLAETTAPTVVKRWIPTGSLQLDYAIRNAAGGGYPEGRIIEIAGPPSIGKSHLAYHAAAVVQSMGGIVVYIDTENATPIDKLQLMGINIKKGFIYCDTHCTEEVFQIVEGLILKAKSAVEKGKDRPFLVIWDSIAASSPKAELEGDYDTSTVGLQARTISKGLRKITGVIGQNNVTFLCLNQLRSSIGVTHGDPFVTPGGAAVPYHSSVRIRLSSGTQVKDPKTGNVIGIHVIMTLKKNKVGPPLRKYEFDIVFGKGIVEHGYIFDEVRAYCENNRVTFPYTTEKGVQVTAAASISGTAAWKLLLVNDEATGEVILEKKFTKNMFSELMVDPLYRPFVDRIIDATYTIDFSGSSVPSGDVGSPDSDEGEHVDA